MAEEKKTLKGMFDYFRSYGDRFDGKFHKIADLAALLPRFRDYYFERRKKDFDVLGSTILKDFNDLIAPDDTFFPYPKQYHSWKKKWDPQILMEAGLTESRIAESKRVQSAIRLRDNELGTNIIPTDDDLERGTNTLAGMLANDAIEMLQDDKELEDIYTSDEMIKRKSYALNVMTHITKKVQGKESLKLKKAAEGRETAGFLMKLLNQAAAGVLSESDITILDASVTTEEAPHVQL